MRTPVSDSILDGIDLTTVRNALDFGLGDGHISRQLLRSGLSVVGVDINPDCGAHFIATLTDAERVRFTFEQLDANRTPYAFPDAAFDLVICREVLEHLHNYVSVLREFSRLLTYGGVLALSVPARLSERTFTVLDPNWLAKCEHVNIFPEQTVTALFELNAFELLHARGTGFRWAVMWAILAPFRVDHVMGNVKKRTRFYNFAFAFSDSARRYFSGVGNRIFPKSMTFVGKKRKRKLLLVVDYDDWILAKWAKAISRIVEGSFDVEIVSMFSIDAEYLHTRERAFDVVHALLPHAFSVCQKLRPRALIATIHHWTEPNQYADIIESTSHIVTGSQSWKQSLLDRGVEESRISMILSGVDASFLAPATPIADSLDSLTLGFFAKADSNECGRKGVDRLLELCSLISLKGLSRHYRLSFTGDGWQDIVDDIERLGISVCYGGRIAASDVIAAYDSIAVYLIPSRVEGGPATASEAMARARIVVSTAVGSVPDIIAHGQTGFIVSHKGFAAETLEILERLRSNVAERSQVSISARKSAEANLGYDITFESVPSLYNSVLAELQSRLPSASI